MQATTTRPKITVTADGEGVVSHAGSRLLADVADRTTLTGELGAALAGLRKPRARHDPGRVLVDMAVAVADGATHDLRCRGAGRSAGVVRGGGVGLDLLAAAGPARHRTRWARSPWLGPRPGRWSGRSAPSSRARRSRAAQAAGRELPGLVIDLDASIVVCHSEKEQAAPTFKKTFGYHPMLAFCDNTGEFLAAVLRRGNAGSNTAADHITVLDAALAQMPDPHRHGTPILVRADGAGCTREFLAHIRGLR